MAGLAKPVISANTSALEPYSKPGKPIAVATCAMSSQSGRASPTGSTHRGIRVTLRSEFTITASASAHSVAGSSTSA
ncbi:Uncharacterised protein [Mycobacteroides abscessus subsp. abscessus]|nr:Uncharacterised protein [Mycobacteroides abscessus subsp. abscessus]